jgi:CTP:molybdopterin cytidylyltransferase MocA
MVVDSVVGQLVSLGVRTSIVCRASDSALCNHCLRLGAEVVQVAGTLDMRASIQAGIRARLESDCPPADQDWCFFMPADLPTIRRELFEAMMEAARKAEQAYSRNTPSVDSLRHASFGGSDSAITPWFRGKAKHPALLRWTLAPQILALAEHAGLNALLGELNPRKLMIPPEWVAKDIDTLAEYQQLLAANQ